jgi:hypothetical protein
MKRLLPIAVIAFAGAIGIAWLQRSRPTESHDTRGPSAAPILRAPGDPRVTPWHPPPWAPAAEDDASPPLPPSATALRDPRPPSYDAVQLYERHGRDVLDLFAAEPRDEAWAQEREGDIVSQALPELQDADHDVRVEVECHTATCRVRVYSWKSMLTEESSFYPLTCLSSYTVPEWGTVGNGSDATPYSDFYMIFGPGTRDRDGFLSRRDGTCARYRDEWRQRALK